MYKDFICENCKKKFSLKILKLPTNLDDKRWEEINCPYCHKANGKELLLGNEDIKFIY